MGDSASGEKRDLAREIEAKAALGHNPLKTFGKAVLLKSKLVQQKNEAMPETMPAENMPAENKPKRRKTRTLAIIRGGKQ